MSSTPRVRKQEVRDRILGAAFELFLDRGVSTSTIEDICERADVANRTFFNHFATRNDMMRALAEERLLNLRDVVFDRENEPIPARLIGLFDDIAATLVQSSDTYREVIAEMLAAAGYGIQRGFALRYPNAGRHHGRRAHGRDRELDCGQDLFARVRPSRPGGRAGRSVGR